MAAALQVMNAAALALSLAIAPAPAKPRPHADFTIVNIQLVGPGLDTWNGRRLPNDGELETRLTKLRQTNPHAVVNIRPYQPGNYNRLYEIALMLRRAGFTPWGLPEDAPPAAGH